MNEVIERVRDNSLTKTASSSEADDVLMLTIPNVLLFNCDEEEAAALLEILSEHAVLTRATNMAEFHIFLGAGNYDALFCGRSFLTVGSRTLEEVRQSNPELTVILLPPSVAAKLEMFEAGALDWLTSPDWEQSILTMVDLRKHPPHASPERQDSASRRGISDIMIVGG